MALAIALLVLKVTIRFTESFDRLFVSRLSPALVYVMPTGIALERAQLLSGLRSGHGSNREFGIEIRGVRVRFEDTRSVLATYEELQRGAKSHAAQNARLSTVLLRHDGEALLWQHVHETWLP